jgi:hypothetical protein
MQSLPKSVKGLRWTGRVVRMWKKKCIQNFLWRNFTENNHVSKKWENIMATGYEDWMWMKSRKMAGFGLGGFETSSSAVM